MRYGRSKAARKTLQFFERTQGIQPPYHILLDGTFLVAIQQSNLPLQDRLNKLLQHCAFSLLVTQSSLDELETLAAQIAAKKELFLQAVVWARTNCVRILPLHESTSHESNPTTTSTTKFSTAGQDIWNWTNPSSTTTVDSTVTSAAATDNSKQGAVKPVQKYFVASQDEELLDALRTMGGVPIIRLARGSVLLLEQPSKSATALAGKEEKHKWTGSVSEPEKRLIQVVKEHERSERSKDRSSTTMIVRRKRKATQPNPLSCKTKKSATENEEKKKRKRRKTNNNTSEGTST